MMSYLFDYPQFCNAQQLLEPEQGWNKDTEAEKLDDILVEADMADKRCIESSSNGQMQKIWQAIRHPMKTLRELWRKLSKKEEEPVHVHVPVPENVKNAALGTYHELWKKVIYNKLPFVKRKWGENTGTHEPKKDTMVNAFLASLEKNSTIKKTFGSFLCEHKEKIGCILISDLKLDVNLEQLVQGGLILELEKLPGIENAVSAKGVWTEWIKTCLIDLLALQEKEDVMQQKAEEQPEKGNNNDLEPTETAVEIVQNLRERGYQSEKMEVGSYVQFMHNKKLVEGLVRQKTTKDRTRFGVQLPVVEKGIQSFPENFLQGALINNVALGTNHCKLVRPPFPCKFQLAELDGVNLFTFTVYPHWSVPEITQRILATFKNDLGLVHPSENKIAEFLELHK